MTLNGFFNTDLERHALKIDMSQREQSGYLSTSTFGFELPHTV